MKVPFRKRLKTRIRRILLALFGVVTLIALIISFEHWRAQRAWRHMLSTIEQRGEPLELSEILGRDIPDGQNFAMTPLFAPLHDYTLDTSGTNGVQFVWGDTNAVNLAGASLPSFLRAHDAISNSTNSTYSGLLPFPNSPAADDTGPDAGYQLDFWVENFRRDGKFALPEISTTPAEDILYVLKVYDQRLGEIAEASRRPYARFTWGPDSRVRGGVLISYLFKHKSWAPVLRLRSAARRAAGNAEGAFEDVMTGLRLADTVKNEPVIIGQLVYINERAIMLKAFWQGWAARDWTDSQLESFQRRFEADQVREALPRAYLGERALLISIFEEQFHGPTGPTWTTHRWLSGLIVPNEEFHGPSGPTWMTRALNFMLIRNQIALCRLMNAIMDKVKGAIETGKPLPDLKELKEGLIAAAKLNGFLPYVGMARNWMEPMAGAVGPKLDRSQVTTDLAAAVCALERFRIRHGAYPDRLEELVPDFVKALPIDLMAGKPFHYRKRDDGWFDLYSIGRDGLDDGGIFRQASHPQGEGDYVWPIPVPMPERGRSFI